MNEPLGMLLPDVNENFLNYAIPPETLNLIWLRPQENVPQGWHLYQYTPIMVHHY